MRHKVVAVAYDRLCTFELGCVVELFALPRPELAVPWYEFAVCAAERGPIRATGGIRLTVPHTLRALESADTIVIPGWRSEEHTSELQSHSDLVCRLLLEKKKKTDVVLPEELIALATTVHN